MWVTEEWGGQIRLSLATRARLFEGRSDLQKVEIVDTEAYGKVLLLDGVFQTSVRDEHVYHELITHPALTMATDPQPTPISHRTVSRAGISRANVAARTSRLVSLPSC